MHDVDKKIDKKTICLFFLWLGCVILVYIAWLDATKEKQVRADEPVTSKEYERGYREGQIDYANGVIAYDLTHFGDRSTRWERVVPLDRIQSIREMRSLQPYKPIDIILLVNLSSLSDQYQLNIRKGARCQMMRTSDGRLHVGYFDEYGVGESYWVVTNEFQKGKHFKYAE